MNSASTNTKESSVMNFLSAVESRTAQPASSGTTLLPQFRAPSWQTGDALFSEFLSPEEILIKIHFLWPCHYVVWLKVITGFSVNFKTWDFSQFYIGQNSNLSLIETNKLKKVIIRDKPWTSTSYLAI